MIDLVVAYQTASKGLLDFDRARSMLKSWLGKEQGPLPRFQRPFDKDIVEACLFFVGFYKRLTLQLSPRVRNGERKIVVSSPGRFHEVDGTYMYISPCCRLVLDDITSIHQFLL